MQPARVPDVDQRRPPGASSLAAYEARARTDRARSRLGMNSALRPAPLRCRRGRRASSAASTAMLARNEGAAARPNTQCTQAPATIAKGKRRIAHDAQPGRNAPDSTPARITAESTQVPRCTSSRRASSARASCREVRRAGSDAACFTTFQMASTVSRSAVIGSRSDAPTRSNDRSCVSTCRGRSDPFTASPCQRARARRLPGAAGLRW